MSCSITREIYGRELRIVTDAYSYDDVTLVFAYNTFDYVPVFLQCVHALQKCWLNRNADERTL